jgi:hypothetical protein
MGIQLNTQRYYYEPNIMQWYTPPRVWQVKSPWERAVARRRVLTTMS